MKKKYEHYLVEDFVKDVLVITATTNDENEILAKVSPLAQRAAADLSWLNDDMYVADSELGFGSTLLHAESDNSLFVVVDSWLPGRGVRPHDHGTWAVVVGVRAAEKTFHPI